MNSIFIIGQHRTGSTLLKNMLDAHSDVTMAFDEMNLFEPLRNNTLDRCLSRNNLTSAQLTELILQKKIYGTFWRDFEKSGLRIEDLRQRLNRTSQLTSSVVLKTILELLREKNNTRIAGVKYPLHFRKTGYLIEHFPNSVILFLTRNPKATIASKLNDEATKKRKEKSVIHRFLVHYFTLIYFSFEYTRSIKMYLKHKNRLRLVTYENLVTKRKETLHELCSSCNITFEENMLYESGKPSSYHIKSGNGVHSKSMEKYKEELHAFDMFIINFLTSQYFKKIKHESGSDI